MFIQDIFTIKYIEFNNIQCCWQMCVINLQFTITKWLVIHTGIRHPHLDNRHPYKYLITGCVTSNVTPLLQYYCSKGVTVEVTHPVFRWLKTRNAPYDENENVPKSAQKGIPKLYSCGGLFDMIAQQWKMWYIPIIHSQSASLFCALSGKYKLYVSNLSLCWAIKESWKEGRPSYSTKTFWLYCTLCWVKALHRKM